MTVGGEDGLLPDMAILEIAAEMLEKDSNL
jgi:hypothetical protein